ncbi:MAG: MotA/TolQ/ExbB proton channel family protein [Kiritimatiellaeota bacterium]|nr:MotA/TolQ/ExbB proton channel family protein [Kiritimatiellota bacterium]
METLDKAFEFFRLGGPVMWPILLCSIMGLSVAFERLIMFWKYNFANRYFRGKQADVIALTRKGEYGEALRVARKAESPICHVLAEALENREAGFKETLEATSQQTIDKLRRGLSLLDTVITAAPMLGILGTVTGIINTFNALNAAGMENPTEATAGISEALITTAAGLIVAIACLFPFNFFVAQLKRRTYELEQAAHHFEIAYNTKGEAPPCA